VPKLPTNMIRRPDRPGFWFRGMLHGKLCVRALGANFEGAKERLRSLKTEGPRVGATVADVIAPWLATDVAVRRCASGQRDTKARTKRYLTPFLGYCRLGGLKGDRIQGYRLELEGQGLAARHVEMNLSDLRRMLNWCVESGYLDKSPFPRRVMPRQQERPPDRVTDKEADTLRALPGAYGFVCRLALGTGMRWGELVRSQAGDLDKQGFLVVAHKTKSGKLRRIPLPPTLLTEVRRRVGKLCPFTSNSAFNTAVGKLSGIASFHVHQCRHTYACQWVEHGGNLAALQQVLGHASIVTTQRYARLGDEAVMREAQRVASVTQA